MVPGYNINSRTEGGNECHRQSTTDLHADAATKQPGAENNPWASSPCITAVSGGSSSEKHYVCWENTQKYPLPALVSQPRDPGHSCSIAPSPPHLFVAAIWLPENGITSAASLRGGKQLELKLGGEPVFMLQGPWRCVIAIHDWSVLFSERDREAVISDEAMAYQIADSPAIHTTVATFSVGWVRK